jgi:hypothetical protein
LTIALVVRDKQRRLTLLRRATQKGWTQRRLRRQVQYINGSRRGGGRDPKLLSTQGCLAYLCELNQRTGQLNKFIAKIRSSKREDYENELARTQGKARENVSQELGVAADLLKDLVKNAQEALSIVNALARHVAGARK